MKVYLLKDCEYGKKGSIKEVSDGFARNFLIPNNIAIAMLGNESQIKVLIEKSKEEKEKKDKKETALSLAIENEIVTFHVDSKEGKLYGSIGASEIAAKLKEKNLAVSKSQVLLDKALKKVGTHLVTIKLSTSLQPVIKVKIVEVKKENMQKNNKENTKENQSNI